MRENAVSPHGKYHRSLPFFAEDRIHHKPYQLEFLPCFGSPHTSANLPCHTLHKREEKADQEHPKWNDKFYISTQPR
jgi:hypothetical protein